MTKEPLTTAGSLPRLNFKILPEFVLFLKNVVKIYTFSGDSYVFLVCSLNVEPQSADKKGSLQNKTLQESVYLFRVVYSILVVQCIISSNWSLGCA